MRLELYELRKEAHKIFDPLWKTGKRSREGAYMVLMDMFKLPREKAHISLLNEDQCKTLINRIETGNYWIGAGMRLRKNRTTIWHKPKTQDKYRNIEKMTHQNKARFQNALHGMKLFRKHNHLTDIPREWKRPKILPPKEPVKSDFNEEFLAWPDWLFEKWEKFSALIYKNL